MDHGRSGLGIVFDCPCCRSLRVLLWFSNPVDGQPPVSEKRRPAFRWTRTGEKFDVLSLDEDIFIRGHWSGKLRNGELIPYVKHEEAEKPQAV